MDFGEKLFGMFSNWRRHRLEDERQPFKYELSDCEKALALIVQPFFEDPVEIHAAKQSGVVGLSFYLPPVIGFFQDRRRNRDLYVHQILMMAGAQKLNLCWPKNLEDERLREIYFHERQNEISDVVKNHYPEFSHFQQQLLHDFHAGSPGTGESWQLWGGLSSGPGLRRQQRPEGSSERRSSQNPAPPVETSFEREEVDLDKEKQNPVIHSFEKMETADEYQGGSRTADGSDQLQEHSEALKELKLKKVTRSGESAAAFLNSEGAPAVEVEFSIEPLAKIDPDVFFYPEWHFKKKRFQENHCRLVITEGEVSTEPGTLRESLKETHRAAIARSQQQLQQIYNQRKWRGQQSEGSELDIDAVVRHFSDLRNKVPSSGGLYMNQFLRDRDFQVLVLIDLSLSTDSYVENRRVLDVEMESVGLMGLLAESLHDKTLVAGTYSETRHHCAFEILKRPEEEWGAFYRRAPRVVPRGYTRLAPAIRHATKILSESEAKDKILLILTDGKPTDYDGYEGRYGIEDIRKACLAAESRHILTKAFAIEKTAKHYFPQMFGSYEILRSPQTLPQAMVQTFLQAQKGFYK